MKFPTSILSLVGILASRAETETICKPSPKVTPKPQYEFTINLTLGAGTNVGIDIWSAHRTYLPVIGGTFCAKWNEGVAGKVVSGVANYYQTANGTGPYKLELEYLIQTSEIPPASIVVKQTGWEVNFVGRTTYVFETGDSKYSFINSGVYIGVETAYVVNGTSTYSSVDGYSLV
ncbi:hypothetical protein ONS95_012802 [Cadophora gregata]|uniref:uncharacterized protein n=1 Tax=Cadophora gregata TaxID=51156 RepID=UPI0026DB9666|nr:uncharacterized protein ONS95_012802 [Cadophora gregata]KAK0101216.1 hypothetical protein ONS96_006438 [Cadophora gregata f. sp. sojae]KAK0115749.1 hypothetical protein ONS95_012802 [Cadophora gregata]